ncbi:putative transporter YycB [Erysipelotrichaceae bacterium]|nr:putative transporter YycB [Erysipelotrichaceae bacterium]
MNKKIQVGILVFFTALTLRIGISSVIPLLTQIQTDFLLNNLQSGIITNMPVICMGIFAGFTPRLMAKFGLRGTIIMMLVLLSIALFGRNFVSGFYSFSLTSFFVGVSTAILGPILIAYIKLKQPENMGSMIALYSLGVGLSALLASSLALPLMQLFGGNWKLALAAFGILSLGVGCLWWFAVPKGEKAELPKLSRLPLKDLKAWYITIIFGVQSGLFYGITTWLLVILMDKNMPLEKASILLMFFFIVQTISSFIIPILVDYFKNFYLVFFGATLILTLGFISLLFSQIEWALILAVGFISFGQGSLFSLSMLLPLRVTKTAEQTSSWTSMSQSGGYIIGGSIPILIGVMRDYFDDVRIVVASFILLSVFLLILAAMAKKFLESEASKDAI